MACGWDLVPLRALVWGFGVDPGWDKAPYCFLAFSGREASHILSLCWYRDSQAAWVGIYSTPCRFVIFWPNHFSHFGRVVLALVCGLGSCNFYSLPAIPFPLTPVPFDRVSFLPSPHPTPPPCHPRVPSSLPLLPSANKQTKKARRVARSV